MGLEKFELKTLSTMDGGHIAREFANAMKRCDADCRDRPSVTKARKINLVVTMEPISDDEAGELDSVNVTFKINDSVPERVSKTYNMKAVRGGLLFNELSPADVHQKTLDMAPEPERTG